MLIKLHVLWIPGNIWIVYHLFQFFFYLNQTIVHIYFSKKKKLYENYFLIINMNIWIISSWLQTNSTTPYVQWISNVTNESTQALLKNDVLKFNILLLYSSTIYLYIHHYNTSIITLKSPWYITIINTKVRKELTVQWWKLWAESKHTETHLSSFVWPLSDLDLASSPRGETYHPHPGHERLYQSRQSWRC